MKIADWIDPADRLRLEAAVLTAEQACRAEISVVLVGACDRYDGAGWRLGIVLAALVVLGIGAAGASPPAWALLGGQALALGLGRWLCRWDAVRRRFVAESTREARVAACAQRAFAETGLRRSPGHGGVLLFAALFERRVVFLADEGAHTALKPGETWDPVVDLAIDGLRDGRVTQGLLAAIERCGQLLSRRLAASDTPRMPLPAPVPGSLPPPLVLRDADGA